MRLLPDTVDEAQFAAVVQRLQTTCPVSAWYFVPGESTRPGARAGPRAPPGRTARAYVQLQRAADVPRAAEALAAERFACAPGSAERVAPVVEYAPYQMMVPPDHSSSTSSSVEDKDGEEEARALFGGDTMFEAFLAAKARNFHTAEAPEAAPATAESAPLVVELAELRDAGTLRALRVKRQRRKRSARM